ncbi:serine hydroxymethyltransferase [Candidatus Peribacteria bacterium]|jgi:glycine hydroxymethyltransferase|nr:serine hydroxymethyltransferase [Candidatus Peribacteria bacterium]MBT4021683.1 serine hydroxymethyltransferase [Candidatus Peribacteria bacterium]MBT4240845.1 serine hydroxymethyltransferase [Candidatus Peribacteria bacterium]MBT4473773.1 serine hydroxymethyltransferase [Candidatus Peribacteria bacterium]
MTYLPALQKTDPEVRDLIVSEEKREADKIRLIPSENYASQAVMEATGSILTNKYSEGYPHKRYYEGQQVTDAIEDLAIDRAKELFGVEHANVQPYSGSPANMAVYHAVLEHGDTIMGLALPHGGHLTHGWKVNFSGKTYNSVPYELDPETEMLDYGKILEKAREVKPKLIVAGYTAYPRIIDWEKFREICDEVGALFHADTSHITGLIVGGVHPNPFPIADTGITTTHKSLRGPRGAMIMSKAEHAQKIDKAIMPGLQGGPHNHTTAAIAVALKEAKTPEFKTYAEQIVKNAKALAENMKSHGLRLVSGGTDNHLILFETQQSKGISGRDAAKALDKAGIVTNCNTVPFDPNPPFNPSGVRIGTPAITSRGMKEDEMKKIGDWINSVLENHEDETKLTGIAEDVKALCDDFSCPGINPGNWS